jgi:PleD family two-component response regulator
LKAEALIRAADESLYKSKLAGRNCSNGQELTLPLPLAAHG